MKHFYCYTIIRFFYYLLELEAYQYAPTWIHKKVDTYEIWFYRISWDTFLISKYKLDLVNI